MLIKERLVLYFEGHALFPSDKRDLFPQRDLLKHMVMSSYTINVYTLYDP